MKKLFLLTLILGVFFTSCKNDNNQISGYENTQTGLYYKFYEENQGDTPETMELLDVVLSCVINDTVVIIPENRMILQMMEPMFAGDIFEGMKMMHKGDSASFIVRTDSTFYTLLRSPLPAEFSVDDIMKFNIRLNDFYPESEFAAKQIEYMKNTFVDETLVAEREIDEYLKNNGIKTITTPTGLKYVKTKEGNGEKPQVGTMVKVHYTGKLLDGTVFDSSVTRNEPFQFVLGVGQVIPGWDEGLQLMSKGEEAVLYIPYYLAYGNTGSGPIPPFATLIFEVEMIDF
jgi:FKBP-type peptidyl-prolyl cis-trans isomerase